MKPTRLLLLAGLGLGTLAHAQLLLADDFEGRTSPFGPPWDSSTLDEGTLTLEAAAAHRGAQGLRFVDTNDAGPAGYGTALVHDMLPPVDGGMWVRFWFRTTRLDTTDSLLVLMMGASAGGAAARQQQLTQYGGTLGVGGFTAAGFTYLAPTSIDAGWHLLEVGVDGLGTDGGRRELWVDGRNASSTAEDFSWPAPFNHELRVGGAYANVRGFRGVLDFDDVRLATAIPASTVTLSLPDAGVVGTCTPGEVRLTSSRGGEVGLAPTTFDVSLALAGGTIHSGPGCTGPSSLRIDAGTVGPWPISWRAPTAGTVTVAVSADDFLPSQVTLPVVPAMPDAGVDAGVDAGRPDAGGGDAGAGGGAGGGGGALPSPRTYDVGCGCTGAPGVWLAAIAVLVLRARRKERA